MKVHFKQRSRFSMKKNKNELKYKRSQMDKKTTSLKPNPINDLQARKGVETLLKLKYTGGRHSTTC